MSDMFFNEAGDIQRSASGDIALVDSPWRTTVQQAYIRIMTDEGDYTMYPSLGATLSQLYGMPQSPATGQLGVQLITNSLTKDAKLTISNVQVKAVPIDFQTIRFDIFITSGSLNTIKLSVAQNLGLV